MDGIGKSKKHLYQKVNQISSSPSTRKADALKPWHHLHDPKDTEISNQSKQGPVFLQEEPPGFSTELGSLKRGRLAPRRKWNWWGFLQLAHFLHYDFWNVSSFQGILGRSITTQSMLEVWKSLGIWSFHFLKAMTRCKDASSTSPMA